MLVCGELFTSRLEVQVLLTSSALLPLVCKSLSGVRSVVVTVSRVKSHVHKFSRKGAGISSPEVYMKPWS